MDAAIRKRLGDKLLSIEPDEQLYRYYEMRVKAIYDYNSSINAAWIEGLKEGLREGKEKAKAEGRLEQWTIIVVVDFKEEGYSAEKIADFIDTPVEEVRKILENKK
jgi:predicted transposase YdaD